MILDVVTFAVSFVIATALYSPFIGFLRRTGSRQVIQAELPESHQKKAGVPTGGGILFVALAVIGGMLATLAGHPGAAPAISGLLLGGVIGFADDLRKLRKGSIGIPARLKFPIQVVLAVPVAWLALGHQSLWWLPLAVIAVVAAGNAVNITDGIDGLAGGLSIIAVGATVLLLPGAQAGEKAVAMTLCGALGGFLVFNRYPARVIMGDTGSLGLGYALAAMAIQQGWMLILPLLGLVFVLETLSVIIQVAYFKVSGGRRVFKMAPIHHTFHQEGWSERRIAVSFWTVGLLAALASLLVAHLVS